MQERLKIEWMDSFAKRLTGALTRNLEAQPHRILIFAPGGSIHTFFMRYNLHVIFLDDHFRTLKSHADVKPWRMLSAPRGTYYVVEAAACLAFTELQKKVDGLASEN